ncbi:unnamed protein product [Cyprideis torosa]|uniref:Uncharacterized protein n=1 Tax=Cyprideis torosa TaxID=163714 RepID=A0A7R8WI47_9CRUS|nr:unnamed protein product [Cyprideis torosa]CAG0894057.1 unnamed protein product [Cyprideis torosa]
MVTQKYGTHRAIERQTGFPVPLHRCISQPSRRKYPSQGAQARCLLRNVLLSPSSTIFRHLTSLPID